MSDEDLIAAHDAIAAQVSPGVKYYLEELKRRDEQRATESMLAYTLQIKWLTIIVTIATVINLMIACFQYSR